MTDDRRDPNAAPAVSGRRRTDPTLTTADIAKRLCVSTQHLVDEIKEGRLIAVTNIHADGKRGIYRISEADLETWQIKYNWSYRPRVEPTDETDETDEHSH